MRKFVVSAGDPLHRRGTWDSSPAIRVRFPIGPTAFFSAGFCACWRGRAFSSHGLSRGFRIPWLIWKYGEKLPVARGQPSEVVIRIKERTKAAENGKLP